MKDYQFMHQALIKEVAKFENAITSQAMSRLGLNYEVSYGLAISQLESIAGIIDKDDNYAQYLWQQKERESKLIALRIFETQEFDIDKLNEFAAGITTVELAEQAAMKLFANQTNVIALALQLIKLPNFAQLAGYLTVSRFAMLNKTAENSIFENLLDELLANKPSSDAIYLRRAFAQALVRIALINTDFADKVKKSVAEIAAEDEKFGNYLKQEVIIMIY